MNIVEVVPLSRAMPFETLLYTSHSQHLVGDLVQVPFQETTLTAVVISIHELASMRSLIRSLPYRIKDGVETVEKQWIPRHYMERLLGDARSLSIPLNDYFRLFFNNSSPLFERIPNHTTSTVTAIQGRIDYRASHYCTSNHPTIIVCPSINHAKALALAIKDALVITTKKQLDNYRARPNNNATTIIVNSFFASVLAQAPSTTLFVFEGILSLHFQRRSHKGGFFHHAHIFASITHWLGYTVILGDELVAFADSQQFPTLPDSYRIPAPVVPSMALQVKHKRTRTLENYQISNITKHTTPGKRTLIFCNQRDLYGYVSCPKCQYIERCEHCNAIVRLSSGKSYNELTCLSCNTHTRARDICRSCGGITLVSRRQGIDGYEHTIRELSSTIPIYKLTNTTKHPQSVISSWTCQGGVLIATSSVFDFTSIMSDTTYISPHSWTIAPKRPEDHLYEYAWLYHRSLAIYSLPITREILTGDPDIDIIDISARAHQETQSALALGITLPCTLL